jgi:hypothetical protein
VAVASANGVHNRRRERRNNARIVAVIPRGTVFIMTHNQRGAEALLPLRTQVFSRYAQSFGCDLLPDD